MDLRVTFCNDAATALAIAGKFLESDPVRHNLILSLLHARMAQPEPGRFWIGERDGRIAGMVFQSPLRVAAVITPMAAEVAASMADQIAQTGISLPGVNGEAASAATFAGQWTERTKTAAVPFEGLRLYELTGIREIAPVDGHLRRAEPDERSLLIEWLRAYQAEVHDLLYDPAVVIDRWMLAGRIWLWDDSQAVSMAVAREQVVYVTRIGGVFTPPEHRRRGYAGACVHALSTSILNAGGRCILYADLSNPTSNSIYRRMGYQAVAEAIRYRFE